MSLLLPQDAPAVQGSMTAGVTHSRFQEPAGSRPGRQRGLGGWDTLVLQPSILGGPRKGSESGRGAGGCALLGPILTSLGAEAETEGKGPTSTQVLWRIIPFAKCWQEARSLNVQSLLLCLHISSLCPFSLILGASASGQAHICSQHRKRGSHGSSVCLGVITHSSSGLRNEHGGVKTEGNISHHSPVEREPLLFSGLPFFFPYHTVLPKLPT